MLNSKDTTFPVFVGHVVSNRNRLLVESYRNTLVIEAPMRLVECLVQKCTGQHSLSQILDDLHEEWNKDDLECFLEELFNKGVLIDVVQRGSIILSELQNPAQTPSRLNAIDIENLVVSARQRQHIDENGDWSVNADSQTMKLLTTRGSCREFGNQEVSIDTINTLVFAAYGLTTLKGTRTVPSAGALYPLQIHLVLNRSSGQLGSGVYQISYGQPGKFSYRKISNHPIKAVRGFLDQLMAYRAHGALIVSGNQQYQSVKYGLRALLYTVLEAGHVAQNIHLIAQEEGVQTVEIGGFSERVLTQVLELETGYQPLTTILFGHSSERVVDDIELEWVSPRELSYLPNFSVAMARLSPEINDDWSYGRDLDPEMAAVKAIAEAREWAACSFVHETTISACASELTDYIHPTKMICFDPSQFRVRNFPFTPFKESLIQSWVVAKNEFTLDSIYVHADLVYFPYDSEHPPIAYANSSGVAAHPNRQQALESAVLELIERDAFMITYFGSISHKKISIESLSADLRQRISALESLGCLVYVVDITLDLAPVFMVMVVQSEWHFMNVAAASRFDPEIAVSHALMEVEASVLARLENGPSKIISPSSIVMPFDHGALYEQQSYYMRADFLVGNKKSKSIHDVDRTVARDWNQLQSRIKELDTNLYTVDYYIPKEYGGNAGLHIVRAIVPGLIPMTFGYRQEPAGMPRLYKIASQFHGRALKYRDLIRFPHPFA